MVVKRLPYLDQSLGNSGQGLNIKAYTRHGRQSLEQRAVVRHRHAPNPLLADPLCTLQPVHMFQGLIGEGVLISIRWLLPLAWVTTKHYEVTSRRVA